MGLEQARGTAQWTGRQPRQREKKDSERKDTARVTGGDDGDGLSCSNKQKQKQTNKN